MVKRYFSYCSGARQDNEDVVASFESGTTRLDLICDGMSGYGYGKLAAELVAGTIMAGMERVHLQGSNANHAICEIVGMANDQVRVQREALKAKFGVTLAGVLAHDGTFLAFWLGDVRIYHIRSGSVLFCSLDHSLMNTGWDKTEEWPGGIEHIVTASVSGRSIGKLAIEELSVNPGDRIVICSDGIWRKIDISTLAEMNSGSLEKFLKTTVFDDDHSLVCYSV